MQGATTGHKVKNLLRYEPEDRSGGTRITWERDTETFETYHEESDTRMHFGVEEIPHLIEVLTDLQERIKDRYKETLV